MNARDVPSAALTSKAKPLFKHQKQSLLVLKKNKRVFDTSDPGTGKTRVEVEDFAARRRAGGGCALVVATKSLLEAAWQKDFNEFAPDMGVSVAFAATREKAFQAQADVYVTNHDAVKWLAQQPKSFFARFDTLIVDESTAFKHHTSQRSAAVAKIAKYFEFLSIISRVLHTYPSTKNL